MTEPKTQKQLTQEVHQGMYGVEGTDDKGLVGDLKELVKEARIQNGRVSKNSRRINIIVGVLIGTGILTGLEAADILHLIGS